FNSYRKCIPSESENLQVTHTGKIGFFAATFTSALCTFNVQDFPFDEQKCAVSMMSQSFMPQEYGYKTELAPGTSDRTAFAG
ncbi:hypothetical protein COOONC_22240, partial [Cooperia oncophora]